MRIAKLALMALLVAAPLGARAQPAQQPGKPAKLAKPAVGPAKAPARPGQPAAQPPKADSAARTDSTPTRAPGLVREVFAYEGGGRDPFLSLLKSGDIRPLLTDLRLVAIVYDQRFPARSVAVLRDITNGKRYRVKPGDIIGRLKATQIKPREVVFTVQEFGFERQETLSLAKQEGTP